MTDMLAKQRLRANLIDQLTGNRRQVNRLGRSAAEADGDGLIQSPGLLIRVLDGQPAPPPSGYILIYAEDESGTVYLRAMDEAGTVKDLDNWV